MNERALSNGESGTYEYVTLLQSFRRGTLSVHWYSPPWYFKFTFSMSVLLRCPSKAAMFSRFLKVAIATLNFINKVYNCGLVFHSRKISYFTFTLGVFLSEPTFCFICDCSWTILWWSSWDFSAILFPIKSPVACDIFGLIFLKKF